MNPLIDDPLSRWWEKESIRPLPLCDDATFLRRITLDLAGRIPTVEEWREFLERPDREEKIESLLGEDAFCGHWADLWTAMLNGYSDAFETDREGLRLWLEEQFRLGRPYDELVGELLTARGTAARNPAVNFLARYPGEESVRVSRLFLGVRLDCARCHDHPYDRWKKGDFAELTRFFEPLRREEAGRGNIRLSDVMMEGDPPRFLTGARPRTRMWRDELSLFIRHTNAFAGNFANRVWYQLMGRGIVHPPDDFSSGNPPSVPELLDHLTERGKENWDLKGLIREICRSRAYQRSSEISGTCDPKRLASFAVRPVRPLTPEQWFASLSGIFGNRMPVSRGEFLKRHFESVDEDFSETWVYRETVQDLMGRLALDLPNPAVSVEDAYHLILSRDPTPGDLRTCAGYSVSEVCFALLNSSEFFFNH